MRGLRNCASVQYISGRTPADIAERGGAVDGLRSPRDTEFAARVRDVEPHRRLRDTDYSCDLVVCLAGRCPFQTLYLAARQRNGKIRGTRPLEVMIGRHEFQGEHVQLGGPRVEHAGHIQGPVRSCPDDCADDAGRKMAGRYDRAANIECIRIHGLGKAVERSDMPPAADLSLRAIEGLGARAGTADESRSQGEGAILPIGEIRVDPAEQRLGKRLAFGIAHGVRAADIGADRDIGQVHGFADRGDVAREVHDHPGGISRAVLPVRNIRQ